MRLVKGNLKHIRLFILGLTEHTITALGCWKFCFCHTTESNSSSSMSEIVSYFDDLWPVVQSIVSLTTLLRRQLLSTCRLHMQIHHYFSGGPRGRVGKVAVFQRS